MSNTTTAIIEKPKVLTIMAQRYNIEPGKLFDTLKATVFKGATDSEFMALCLVANEYELNPLIKQIYAFPGKSGGIVPVVSIDGWIAVVLREKRFNGVRWEMVMRDAKTPESATCFIKVKGMDDPVEVTEHYDEVFRDTPSWKGMPRRMIRHKAYIQCARYAFGLSGIYDEDEARDIIRNNEAPPMPGAKFLGGVTSAAEYIDVKPAAEPESQAEPDKAAKPKRVKREPVAEAPVETATPTPPAQTTPEPPAELSGIESTRKSVRDRLTAIDVTEDTLIRWGQETQNIADTVETFNDIDHKTLLYVVANWSKIRPDLETKQKALNLTLE